YRSKRIDVWSIVDALVIKVDDAIFLRCHPHSKSVSAMFFFVFD
ncbi:MAG: hypothetical protein ACI9OO_000996, partial [Bacteroidia bacterium]